MKLQRLFQGYTKRYGLFTAGEFNKKGKLEKKKAVTVNGEVQDIDWARHRDGDQPGVGIIPLMDDDESVMFGCIDVDVYGVDVPALERQCLAANIPVTFSLSKSKGAHVWLFCAEPMPAELVQRKLAEVAAWLGHGGCEIFPKQVSRANEADTGNWINLPFFGNSRPGMINGEEITDLNVWADYAESRRATILDVMSIKVAPTSEMFADGPPCLQHLQKAGFVSGTLNNSLFNIGVYFRQKYPDNWEKELIDYSVNDFNSDEPASVRGTQAICENLRKKDYSYMCQQPPIVSCCNKQTCMKREFGIGGAARAELDLVVGQLTKYDSRPPMWVLEINGKRVQIETDDLMQFARFSKICVENLNHFPTFVPPKIWQGHVKKWLAEVDVLPAPEDASPEGQFFNLVQEFVSDRQREDADEITLGNVWVKDGWAYFRSTDLVNFLRRAGFHNYAVPRLYSLLNERRKAERGELDIKGAVVPYWKIEVTGLQNTAFKVPNFEGAF